MQQPEITVLVDRRGMYSKAYNDDMDDTPRGMTFDAYDNRERYIAQSILTGILDESYTPTTQEARDVIAWAGVAA